MPTVAEKLCRDLVEPVFKPSSINNNVKFKQVKKPTKSSSNFSGKPNRAVYLEKRRVINKIIPSENKRPSLSKTLKSKETILKKCFVDIAVNTLATGPLRCDNYCVTMVRKRDQNSCKCSKQKVKPKASSKIIQTLYKNSFMDKACAQSLQKVNCGTQFLEWQSSILKSNSKRAPKSKTNINFIIPKDSLNSIHDERKSSRIYINCNRKHSEPSYHNLSAHCLGGKRWALSNYPIRGPDF
ncbi:unnamed protein product [Colias eurytheme]|nr:unnamed protein product [Colias eurytheme]